MEFASKLHNFLEYFITYINEIHNESLLYKYKLMQATDPHSK